MGAGTGSTDPVGINVDVTHPGNTSYVVLANNTIVNTSIGIDIGNNGGSVTVANTILYKNGGGLDHAGSVAFTSTHNDVCGNVSYRYSGASLSATDLTVDPRFDSSNDYDLSAPSPLIDAGDDSYVEKGDKDVQGAPRIYGSHVDIGAYEWYPAPTITALSPDAGPVGTVVTITGTNLEFVTGINFHDAAATKFASNQTGTQITVTVPFGAIMGAIRVTTYGGAVTSSQQFTVTNLPTITSFPPSGGIGTSIVITGTNLTTTNTVTFNGTTATKFTVNSATQITAVVPVGTTTGLIHVTTSYGIATSASNFTVVTAPTASSFTPASGPVGTVVTITGTNLGGVSAIRFHDASATDFSANGAGTQVTVTVPNGALTGTITVTTPGGSVQTAAQFTVTTPPTITSFTPTSGLTGTVVTITGTNFGGVTAVRFHNANATVFSANGAGTQITVTVPTGALTGTIKVTTPAGAVTSAQQFTVTP